MTYLKKLVTMYIILYGVETGSTRYGGFFVQGRGQRGSLKTLNNLIANDNVENYNYALAA